MRDLRRIAVVFDVGRADQREVALVRDREDDALVGVLEDVGVIVRRRGAARRCGCPSRAARCAARRRPSALVQQCADPRARGIRDRRARTSSCAPSVAGRSVRVPFAILRARADERVRVQHGRAALGGIERIQHDETRVVDPAIRVDEAARDRIDERLRRPDGAAGRCRASPAAVRGRAR